MDDDQQFCLRWNNHQSTLISVFDTLLENETLVDCTLAAEGKYLKAHKVVLSACSPYFATLLQEQYDKHPIFILKDVKYQELRAMMDYMYRGEVNISQDQLAALLKAAESLQIKGLSDNRTGAGGSKHEQQQHQHHRNINVPAGGKMSGAYTLEQAKRARVGPDSQDITASREGSSSPSRRRKKVRRRSIDNVISEMQENSNSSQMPANQQSALLQQSNAAAGLAGVGAITAAASALASQQNVSSATHAGNAAAITSVNAAALAAASSSTTNQQQMTTSIKKTESVKGTQSHDHENAANATADEQDNANDNKLNHKHQQKSSSASKDGGANSGTELVIEPKSEYDDENVDNVEDLTMDDEDMGMDDLDNNAGTSQGGEGSSQGYGATWQHDRSQDELLLGTQEAQQRDPQETEANDNAQSSEIAITSVTTQDGQVQSESRIRVRNWLMLADQNVLNKSIQPAVSTEIQQDGTNQAAANNNNINGKSSVAAAASSTSAAGLKISQIDTSTATMTRIGSIGRTTIACITPAVSNVDGKTSSGNVGVMSAAALQAAGVELDSVDDNSTEVIVKIENNDDDEVGQMLEELEAEVDEVDDEYNYELKLCSPMSWDYGTVKIENEEEFEDLSGDAIKMLEHDTNTNNTTTDDDDLLTTAAAATSKQMEVSSSNSSKRSAGSLDKNYGSGIVKKRTALRQSQQQLLNQQKHLQNLQLQPISQAGGGPIQIKLASIPATITSISKPVNIAPASSSALLQAKNEKNAEFQSSVSDDKRYRILIQNQRMRKESLEHSEDMIYNSDIEKPWVCRNCNRNYKWKNSLKCHLKNECGQPPRYFCSKLCGYATNVHSNLKRHLNTKCRDRQEEETPQKSNIASYTMVVQEKSD